MKAEPIQFEAGGIQFRLGTLSIKQAQKINGNIVRLVKPIIGLMKAAQGTALGDSPPASEEEGNDNGAGGDSEESAPNTKVAKQLFEGSLLDVLMAQVDVVSDVVSKDLAPIQDMFLAVCEVQLPENFRSRNTGKEVWVPLKNWSDDLFARRHSAFLEWTMHCVMIEFVDFLAVRGLSQSISKAVSDLTSRLSSIGNSGE